MFWRTHVLNRAQLLGYSRELRRLPEQRGQEPVLASRAHPLHPLGGAVELLGAGQVLRLAPGTVERPDPVRGDDLVREGLAAPVLGELHLEAEELRDDRVEQATPLAVAIQRGAELGEAGVELIADGVHD